MCKESPGFNPQHYKRWKERKGGGREREREREREEEEEEEEEGGGGEGGGGGTGKGRKGAGKWRGRESQRHKEELLKVTPYCLKAYDLGLKEGPIYSFIFPEQTRPKVSPTPNKAYGPRCPEALPACEL
jgi:hypothetical protein